jgi:glycosidase
MKRLSLLLLSLLSLHSLDAADLPLHQREARPSPEWLTGGVIYQIQPRTFTPEGTLKAAQARLPKLTELGVTVLYLCPVFVADDDMDQTFWSPRQKKSGMNNPRNPYRMKDFYHVDPEYGTDQDLKDFVAAAHALKLRVMLDMVYLHCGPKPVFLESHPDFLKRAEDGKAVNAAWAFPALNFANPELREYLWKNMEMWIRDFDVDGFRCDVADRVPLDFWEAGRERIEKIKPDVGMLAEGTRKADQLKAFDLDYGWGKAFAEFSDAAAVRKLWESLRNERPIGGAKFARFIDNHDIANDDYDNRLEKRWGAARVEAALTAIFALDGVPFLYNGQEVADTARHSIFGKTPIDWANGETAAGKARFAFVQKLCALRKAEPALTRGELTWLDTEAPEAVLAFARKFNEDRITVFINLTGKPVTVGRVTDPSHGGSAVGRVIDPSHGGNAVGRVTDPSHGAVPLLARGVSHPFTLAPHGFIIVR